MKIGNHIINDNSNCLIIAEISANHGHDINIAKESIKAAKECGADAVKIQTYTPDTITIDCDNNYFQIKKDTIWDGKTLYDLYSEAYTPWDWQPELIRYANELGITLFSTPFDKTSVDFLESLNVPAYKIASFEITDIPLIEYIASKNKPILISTGIATIDDISECIAACKRMNNENIILLHCTSSYPAKIDSMNLNTLADMKNKFNKFVGLSDHSLSIEVPIVAIALGAKVIEKHFIVDRSIGGPDEPFSLNKDEFKSMVLAVRNAELALGKIDYSLTEEKKKNREFSKSLFVVDDIKEGEVLTENNLRSIRPGYGLHPRYYYEVLGRKVNVDIKKGTPFSLEFLI